MDEPDAGLDAASRGRIHDLLLDQADRRGAVVVCATHHDGFIAAADRVVRLESGRQI